ncbi:MULTISPECIES: AIR synthase-related protein, partial [unclassified Methylobacterium]
LAGLAADGLARAAKDISMAGLVGTALMLMECSGVGGRIDLDRLPIPDGVALERWLTAFPSFGYLVAAAPAEAPAVVGRFTERGIAAAGIGSLDASRVARVARGTEEAVVWDFGSSPLIGCGATRGEGA